MNVTPPIDIAPLWDIAKGVMLTLTTAGVGWTARTVFVIRDDMRDLKTDVHGRDGTNGIKSMVKQLITRVDAIEDRNLVIDAVAEAEKEEYTGDERRHGLRSVRELIRSEVASLIRPRGAT